MHTKTQLDVLRQGIEIQGVVRDDFGNLIPGPNELWGNVDGCPVTIASVERSGNYSIDDAGCYEISEEEAIANLRRLAHCWNCHDDLLAALEAIDVRLRACFADPISASEAYDSFYQEIVAEAIRKARGE